MTVLCWIRSDPRNYQTYVANRLGEIDELTEASSWRWVSSENNPADDATKVKVIKIGKSSQWLNGPRYLQVHESKWPIQPKISDSEFIRR